MAEIEVSDKEFQEALEEQRHEELMDLLKSVVKSIPKTQPVNLDEVIKRLDLINKTLTQTKYPDTTEYSKKIVDLLNQNLQELRMLKEREQVKEEVKEWEFIIERSFDGTIKKVKAKQV